MFDDDEISLPWPEIPIDQLQLWLKVRQGEPVKYMLAPIGKFPMLSTHKAVLETLLLSGLRSLWKN